MPRLENWSLIDVNGEESLAGYVYDDERKQPNSRQYADGHRLITSKVMSLDRAAGTAQTRNTLYSLGEELVTEEPLTLGNLDTLLPRISQF
jgi:hypothetical protein